MTPVHIKQQYEQLNLPLPVCVWEDRTGRHNSTQSESCYIREKIRILEGGADELLNERRECMNDSKNDQNKVMNEFGEEEKK